MIWNKTAECMPREQIRALQLERLQKLVLKLFDNVPFYREKFQEAGIEPNDIRSLDDLQKLPFTNKTDLRDNYPYGLFAEPLSKIVRIHASSGTTGKPTVVGYTRNDLNMWAECAARALACAGATSKSVIQNAYGYGLFTGGLGIHGGAERLGASIIPMSGGNTQKQLMLMKDFGSTHLTCTPSYANFLGENVQKMALDLDSFALKAGIFGGEPWSENMRQSIEERLGIEAFDIYGLSEICGPGVGIECTEHNGLHIWEDNYIIEIIDPATGEVLLDGEDGELVFTTINKEGIPLLRYRTHDLTHIISEPCPCGRTHRKIARLKGRTDDMMIIRGVNVFPGQIESALAKFEEVGTQYQIIVRREGDLDTIEVNVELSETLNLNTIRQLERLQQQIKEAVHSVIGLNAKISLVEPMSLPRTDGKTQHVVDLRNI